MRFWVQVEALFGVNVIISRKRDNKRDNSMFLSFCFVGARYFAPFFLFPLRRGIQGDVIVGAGLASALFSLWFRDGGV